jgi:4-diphosphocytidyl-2-C-methyl-D-erythritol kinase
MVAFPNGKINLGLHVCERKADGFHTLESIKIPIGWHDSLEIIPSSSDGLRLITHGKPIPESGENILDKAYKLLSRSFDLPGIECHLIKNIPMGAGLGGGSSNASFFIKMMNTYFGLGFTDEDMQSIVAKLGSDCPFFINNQAAFATGTGIELEPIDIDLDCLQLLVVHPGIHVSTAWAYKQIKPNPDRASLKELIRNARSSWLDLIVNDFETPIFQSYPEIGLIKMELLESGALYASMSGSGSAVYALFENGVPQFEWPPHYSTWQGPATLGL